MKLDWVWCLWRIDLSFEDTQFASLVSVHKTRNSALSQGHREKFKDREHAKTTGRVPQVTYSVRKYVLH